MPKKKNRFFEPVTRDDPLLSYGRLLRHQLLKTAL